MPILIGEPRSDKVGLHHMLPPKTPHNIIQS
jgi:hypothetical protein